MSVTSWRVVRGGIQLTVAKRRLVEPWARTKSKQRENGDKIEYSPGVRDCYYGESCCCQRISRNERKGVYEWGNIIVDGDGDVGVRVGGNTRPDAARCPKRSRRLISPDFLFLVGRQKAKKSQIPSKNDSLSQPESVAVKRQGCDLTSVWSPRRAIGGTLGVASRLETVETWSTVH